MSTVISVENLSKAYRLGQIGTGTLTNDLKIWWAKGAASRIHYCESEKQTTEIGTARRFGR